MATARVGAAAGGHPGRGRGRLLAPHRARTRPARSAALRAAPRGAGRPAARRAPAAAIVKLMGDGALAEFASRGRRRRLRRRDPAMAVPAARLPTTSTSGPLLGQGPARVRRSGDRAGHRDRPVPGARRLGRGRHAETAALLLRRQDRGGRERTVLAAPPRAYRQTRAVRPGLQGAQPRRLPHRQEDYVRASRERRARSWRRCDPSIVVSTFS